MTNFFIDQIFCRLFFTPTFFFTDTVYHFIHCYYQLHSSDSPNSTYNWQVPRKWMGSAITAITFPYFLMHKERYNRLDYFRMEIIQEIRSMKIDLYENFKITPWRLLPVVNVYYSFNFPKSKVGTYFTFLVSFAYAYDVWPYYDLIFGTIIKA